MDPTTLILAGAASSLYFYVVGGILVVLALAFAFAGLRNDDFPATGAMRGIVGLFTLVVVATAVGAVWAARDEQAERRLHNEEAAHEADEATEGTQAAESKETEGEAASPAEGGTGARGDIDGAQLFTSTGCGSCHTLAAAGTDGQIGPNLDETLPGQPPEAIRTSIVDPGAETVEGFPAGTMPSNYEEQLSDAELAALVSYLGTVAGG